MGLFLDVMKDGESRGEGKCRKVLKRRMKVEEREDSRRNYSAEDE